MIYGQSTTAAQAGTRAESEAKATLVDLAILFKPMVLALVLVAALAGAYIAQRGLPPLPLVLWTLFGTGLATAAAAALNNYIDRDIDLIMKRTRERALPAGLVRPRFALAAGFSMALLSAAALTWFVNAVAAALAMAALFIYVVPYTLLSKRRTPLATFIGGVGGALPPVIGYAAVKPDLDAPALVLFLIIFVWQHPHFWTLGLKYREEYAAAGVRNLCVVEGPAGTKKSIVVWAGLLAAASLTPYWLGMAGGLYLAVAAVMGVVFLAMSVWFLLSPRRVAMSLFFYSIIHLPALYCAMVVDIL
ncbi:MAG: heme o synthase [Candidatus Nitrospinota bacterium M3_3B_026]